MMKLLYPNDPTAPLAALDLFIKTVQDTDEWDYGDCMRIWNHDLMYLRDHLKDTTPWALSKLDQMKFYIQYQPNWDVPSTRARILQDAREIREHLVLNENSGRAA